MSFYEFECGCKIPLVNDEIKACDGLPSLEIDFDNINYNCPLTWTLYAEGRTKGVFQLEKSLGQNWSKQVKPISIEEVAALISIIRPGTLKSLVDGKSMTKHFVDRKDGEESFEYFHHDAEPLLNDSYGVIIYQEQTIRIAEYFAGFTKVQADSLRKAMGKKLADVMAKCRTEFIEGCKKTGILRDDDAEALFDIIEKSNRYSFNKSHAVSYGVTGYLEAWVKAHFPLHFYCSKLITSSEKMKPREEVKELVLDAKHFNIDILPPSIQSRETEFHLDNGKVRFGIGNVKEVGESKVIKAIDTVKRAEEKVGKTISNFTYYEMLVHVMYELDKTSASNLILAGAFSGFYIPRKRMLFDYKKLTTLTEKEMAWVKSQNFTDIIDAFRGLIESKVPNKTRVEKIKGTLLSLESPPEELKDSNNYIASVEEELFGISLACSKLDSCDISGANCTVAEFSDGKDAKSFTFALQVDTIRDWYPKDSKIPLAFVDCHDDTGKINAMLPSNLYKEYISLLFPGNTVLITGYRNNKGNLNIRKVVQL